MPECSGLLDGPRPRVIETPKDFLLFRRDGRARAESAIKAKLEEKIEESEIRRSRTKRLFRAHSSSCKLDRGNPAAVRRKRWAATSSDFPAAGTTVARPSRTLAARVPTVLPIWLVHSRKFCNRVHTLEATPPLPLKRSKSPACVEPVGSKGARVSSRRPGGCRGAVRRQHDQGAGRLDVGGGTRPHPLGLHCAAKEGGEA